MDVSLYIKNSSTLTGLIDLLFGFWLNVFQFYRNFSPSTISRYHVDLCVELQCFIENMRTCSKPEVHELMKDKIYF